MAHVRPLAREELQPFEPLFELVERGMGFVPNSMLTMGRWPELLRGFAGLAGTALNGGVLPASLKQLVAHVASHAAGCRYCQAHTAHSAEGVGVEQAKIEAALEFETSNLFEPAERAALRLARDAALAPNAVEAEHFEELRRHFGEREIVELVGVIALFGFLNRWNDTMATALEASPRAFGEKHLSGSGWQPGKHS